MNNLKIGDICEVVDNSVDDSYKGTFAQNYMDWIKSYWNKKIVKIINIKNYTDWDQCLVNLIDGPVFPLYFDSEKLRLLKEKKQVFSELDPYGEEDWEE